MRRTQIKAKASDAWFSSRISTSSSRSRMRSTSVPAHQHASMAHMTLSVPVSDHPQPLCSSYTNSTVDHILPECPATTLRWSGRSYHISIMNALNPVLRTVLAPLSSWHKKRPVQLGDCCFHLCPGRSISR